MGVVQEVVLSRRGYCPGGGVVWGEVGVVQGGGVVQWGGGVFQRGKVGFCWGGEMSSRGVGVLSRVVGSDVQLP